MTSPSDPQYAKPLPSPSPVSQPFWDGTKAGELRLQRCRDCGQHIFYPRSMCPFCLSEHLEWVAASGRGKVYSYTVVRRAMNPAFQEDVPYLLAIVELDEGPRLTTNIVNCAPDEARVDMPVKATYDDVTPDITLLKFEPLLGPEAS
ncbi:MAG TPA: Zn-ribbon domain-containing OB-fold protein [Dehalococcoidia bacterium]|nr:Zn-ribbon domain-containing OB-fold protein [Dehalococcoidia bacterium]